MSPAKLPEDVLLKRQTVPLKVSPVTLIGQTVRLELLDLERDSEALYAVSNGSPIALGGRSCEQYDSDKLIWRYMSGGPFTGVQAMREYLRPQVEATNGLCLCVYDKTHEKPVGVATYMNNMPEHLKVELGNIWYSPIAQSTNANTEATYLMLKHAFELGYRRLEWKCNALNERSRRAALRMGFKFEGIQEYHFIVKGYNRDTAWFRVLDREWPDVKVHLEQLLYSGT